MSDIHHTIKRTENALSRAIGARTSLSRCPVTPWRRELLSKLEAVVAQLEVELSRLRYAASHASEARP